MIVVVALVTFLWLPQQQAQCDNLDACRAMAEAAWKASDFETFHDLAWAAYRKGKSNDTELMLLVARAQSLSGRPGDALVMLERIAALGGTTDATTSEDFVRVRALPRWTEVAEKLSVAFAKVPTSAEASTTAKATVDQPVEKTADKPSAKEPAPPAKEPAPSPKAPAPSAKEPAPSATAPARSANAPLTFTTLLTPSAVAFDGVSQRFLIADRQSRRVAVVDANTGQVATMVGALGSPGEIAGMAIDAQQGDLWVVVTTNEQGSVLHKLQLISGRVLATMPLAIDDRVTAMTYARGAGLIVADANGVIWRVGPDGKAGKLASLEYVPQGLTADTRGRLYVAGGTSRVARFTVGSTLRRIDTIDIDRSIPADAPFVAVGSTRLSYIVPTQGSFEIRNVPVK